MENNSDEIYGDVITGSERSASTLAMVPRMVRYIHLFSSGSSSSSYNGNPIQEIRAMTEDGINVALGKAKVGAFVKMVGGVPQQLGRVYTHNGGRIEHITDGIIDTSRYHDVGYNDLHVRLDLGQEYRIESINISRFFDSPETSNFLNKKVGVARSNDQIEWIYSQGQDPDYDETIEGKTFDLERVPDRIMGTATTFNYRGSYVYRFIPTDTNNYETKFYSDYNLTNEMLPKSQLSTKYELYVTSNIFTGDEHPTTPGVYTFTNPHNTLILNLQKMKNSRMRLKV